MPPLCIFSRTAATLKKQTADRRCSSNALYTCALPPTLAPSFSLCLLSVSSTCELSRKAEAACSSAVNPKYLNVHAHHVSNDLHRKNNVAVAVPASFRSVFRRLTKTGRVPVPHRAFTHDGCFVPAVGLLQALRLQDRLKATGTFRSLSRARPHLSYSPFPPRPPAVSQRQICG